MIVYSASDCWGASYQLGLLTYAGSGDPLQASSWTKKGPVFSSANGNYGTGHNGYVPSSSSSSSLAPCQIADSGSFFTSPDGTETWNVYHATANSQGACDSNRYTMAQEVNWNSDGTPDFGKAPALSTVLQGPSGEPA